MFGFDLGNGNSLRLLERHHAGALFALTDANRQQLREWLPWVDLTNSETDSRNFIAASLEQFAKGNGFQAGIWHGDQIAGCIGFHAINWSNGNTSLGYWLGSAYQGKGLMTSACRALIDHAYSEFKLHRVEIRCATENKKSRAIPERLDFQLEGTLRQIESLPNHGFVDHAVYAKLKSDWRPGLKDPAAASFDLATS